MIPGNHPTQCGFLKTVHLCPLEVRRWTSTEEKRSLYQLSLNYGSQLHIFIVFLSLLVYISPWCFSPPIPIPKASKILKYTLKENCMVSATGMCYHFTVAIHSSLPGLQMENPSWPEEPYRGGGWKEGEDVSWILFLPSLPFPLR